MRSIIIILAFCSQLTIYAVAQNVGIGTTSPTHQLHTTQEVRHESLMGHKLRPVMADSTGVLVTDMFKVSKIDSNSVGMSIPEYNCNGVTSIINTSGWPSSVNPKYINVEININHPYTYDLVAFLVSPFNDTLMLLNKNGLGANLTKTKFSDNALIRMNEGSNPFPFEYQSLDIGPINPLCFVENSTISKFANIGGGTSINPNGQWKLVVKDLDYYTTLIGLPMVLDTGRLMSWKIFLNEPIASNLTVNDDKYAKWKNGTLTYSNTIKDNNADLLLTPAGNIGVGIINPQNKLDVNGNATFRGSNYAIRGLSNGTIKYAQGRLADFNGLSFLPNKYTGVWGNVYHNTANGYGGVFSAIDTTIGTAQKYVLLAGSNSNPAAAFMGGNVGIGTTTPQHQLTIGENVIDNQAVTFRSYSNATTNWKGSGAFGYNGASVIMGELNGVAQIGGHNSNLSAWAPLAINAGGGLVGIGTDAPATKLDVIGTTRTTDLIVTNDVTTNGLNSFGGSGTSITAPLKISSGTPGLGKVLTSDATGNATWQLENDPQVGPNTTNYVSKWNGTSLVNSLILDNGSSLAINQIISPLNQLYVYRTQVTSIGDGQATLLGYRNRDSQNDGTSYSYGNANTGTTGYNHWGDEYSFGLGGWNYNDFARCGGTFGSHVIGIYWGSLGYRSSGLVNYGVYGNSAYNSGTGFLPTADASGVGGGFFGVIGSLSKGSVIGQINEGELFATYNKGDVYTSGKSVELVTTDDKVVPSYAVTSAELTVYDKGKIMLVNGTANVVFGENYTNLLGEAPVVTASPMGECNGVYVSAITKNGFVIKELNKGNSTVEIAWIAVGNRVDAAQAAVPKMLTNTEFNRNISKALFSDGDTKHSAIGMWWNGTELKFGDMPATLNLTREQKIKMIENEKKQLEQSPSKK